MLGSLINEAAGDNSTISHNAVTDREVVTELYGPGLKITSSIAIISGAVISLLSNVIMLCLVTVIRRLQRTQNAFIIHQLFIDAVKSVHVVLFAKSLYEGQPSRHCAALFSSYIILVTATTFNLMAITTTEIYHFTNKLVEISISNYCCICFGIVVVWVTSVVVNLGVAFMPSISTFNPEIGICSFAYGITGNYLLHLLWIGILTMIIVLNIIYLCKLRLDINRRHYQRIFQLLSSTSCLEEMEFAALSKPNSVVQSYHKHSTATVDKVGTAESNNNDMKMTNDGYHSVAQSEDMTQTINQSEDMVTDDAEKFYGRSLSRCSVKSRANSVRSQRFSRASVKSQTSCVESSAHPTPVRHRLPRAGRQRIYVHRRQSSTQKAARAITDGTRNLYILVTMVLSFVVFWYPLFLLTIIDVFVKAEPMIYRALTLLGWSHSLTTPIFFIGLNYNALFDKEKFEHDNQVSMDVNGNGATNGHVGKRPDSLEIPDTPMSYTSELSYKLICQLIDEKVSPGVISHVADLQNIKSYKSRRLMSSVTCPERLNAAGTLNSIPEYQPIPTTDDMSAQEDNTDQSSSNLSSNLPGQRQSTGCLMDQSTHQDRSNGDSLSMSDLNLPIHAWI